MALLSLTVTASMAQRQAPYANCDGPGFNRPGYGQPGYAQQAPNWGTDYRQDVFRIERLDRIVNLTGRQKRALFRIEQFYDREITLNARHPEAHRRLMWQKSQDVLAVLSPLQRDRLAAFEQYRPYSGYGNGYGNGYGRYGRRS